MQKVRISEEEKRSCKGNGVDIEKYNYGEHEIVSSSRLFSLFAAKDRDFLLSPGGTRVKIADLEGKILGIYFSANWNALCRKFTKVLAECYEQLRNHDPSFEVVFVSSDEDQAAFDDYRSSMPWLAVPFSDMETKKSLNRKFDVEDIPCLVISQPNHDKDAVIRDGVDLIYRYGVEACPFTSEKVEELKQKDKDTQEKQNLQDLLINHERDFLLSHNISKQVPVTSLMGKTIGLYFTAQWCSPGEKFTPKLASIYEKVNHGVTVNSNHHDFEIVFVSSDHDQTAFDSYFQTMPWMAIPYGDPTVKYLTKYFDVQGIPSLVIVGPNGKTLTGRGRNLVNLYRENAYPFTEARIQSLQRHVDEEAKHLPDFKYHSGHHHELMLVSEGTGGGPFICCDCDEQGLGWAYQCIECGYEVHPKCVRSVEHG